MIEINELGCELFFENEAKVSYLVLKAVGGQRIIPHQLAMLMNNSIPFSLALNHREWDGFQFLYYDITSKQPLQQLLTRKKLKQIEFLNILLEITKGLLNSSSYLLNYQSFVLDEKYIYINPSTLEVYMLYLPYGLEGKNVLSDLKSLANRLILALDPREAVKDSFIHRVLSAIHGDNIHLKEFNRLLKELKQSLGTDTEVGSPDDLHNRSLETINEGPAETHIKSEATRSITKEKETKKKRGEVSSTISMGTVPKKRQKKYIFALTQVILGAISLLLLIETSMFRTEKGGIDIASLFGWLLIISVIELILYRKIFEQSQESGTPLNGYKTIKMNKKEIVNINTKSPKLNKVEPEFTKPSSVKEDHFETQLIEIDNEIYPQLVGTKDGLLECVKIDKPSFIIGKMKEQVDYVILSKAVSRIHAEIGVESGTYYVRDLNSKNGTFINGEQINSNLNLPIKNGDELKFANREYRFILKPME